MPWRLYTIANVDSKCYSYTDSNSYADFDAETFTNAETGANA